MEAELTALKEWTSVPTGSADMIALLMAAAAREGFIGEPIE